jgi:hypothetical protein
MLIEGQTPRIQSDKETRIPLLTYHILTKILLTQEIRYIVSYKVYYIYSTYHILN